MKELANCDWCGNEYNKIRDNHRFCDDPCRKKWNRRKNKQAIIPDFITKKQKPIQASVQSEAPLPVQAVPAPAPPVQIQVPQPMDMVSQPIHGLPNDIKQLQAALGRINNQTVEGSNMSKLIGFGIGSILGEPYGIKWQLGGGLICAYTFNYLDKMLKENKQNILRNSIAAQINYLQSEIPNTTQKMDSPNGLKEKKTGKILSGAEYREKEIPTIGLTGKYKYLIGDPGPGFYMLVTGRPGHGKSTFTIQFAQYLQENHGRVLYLPAEQPGLNLPLQRLLRENNVSFDIHTDPPSRVDLLEKIIAPYDYVIFDSVNHMHLQADDLALLRKKLPKVSFICIMQSTKTGDFKGSQQFLHDCDIQVELERPKVYQRKSRYAPEADMILFAKD